MSEFSYIDDQNICDAAYQRWLQAIKGASFEARHRRWILPRSGISFHIDNQSGESADTVVFSRLGDKKNNIVTIRRPVATAGEKHRVTIAARASDGKISLLREGRLQANNISKHLILESFERLSELRPIELLIGEEGAKRQWFKLATTDDPEAAVSETTSFVRACLTARLRTGGTTTPLVADETEDLLGVDEKGRMFIVTKTGGTSEMCARQGYVWEALKRALDSDFVKPRGNGYEADGLVKSARLLIEIKTSTFASDLYAGVGQLRMYPLLLALREPLQRILLIPNKPMLLPVMAAAIAAQDVEVHTYSVDKTGTKVVIPDEFIERCRSVG
ncbi:hypothetical protein DWF04_015300 [Cereibacter sphaeroides f. sp. denitrificans]|nr:hypothetical protein DWF04_16615 [Cereibacter sphaeroides f. sp. denitrificans]